MRLHVTMAVLADHLLGTGFLGVTDGSQLEGGCVPDCCSPARGQQLPLDA